MKTVSHIGIKYWFSPPHEGWQTGSGCEFEGLGDDLNVSCSVHRANQQPRRHADPFLEVQGLCKVDRPVRGEK
jgi:hypothetical protein